MENFYSYSQFLSEKKQDKKKKKYDYCCLMADVTLPEEIKVKVKEKDIYQDEEGSFGLETRPHITILYGIHDSVKLSEMKAFVSDITPIDDIVITGISCFESKEYDVLKYDIESPTLCKLNKKLCKQFPYTTDYPDYHPHLTISYVKKGKGKSYEVSYKKEEKVELSACRKLSYSLTSGEKKFFTLKDKE